MLTNHYASFLRLLASPGWQSAPAARQNNRKPAIANKFIVSARTSRGRRFSATRSQPNITGNKLLWVGV
jgi:hypothetical protein